MFLISLFFVLMSSYLLVSCLMKKESKNNLGIIYLLLISFSQIILTFEGLSLTSSISEIGVLSINVVFLIASVYLWVKQNRPIYKPFLVQEISSIKKALKKDKLLNILSFCFIVFLISQLLVAVFYPVTFGDAFSYYFPRCTTWIQQGNLNHFLTYDVREVHMPINMDLLYTWYLLFFKHEQGISIFSYCAFLTASYVIYNFLGELGFCRRKRLWTVFVFSSFALIGVMSYTPSSDLLVGSLVLTTIYLFYVFLKRSDGISFYFSTLSLAIALGSKITAFFTIPALFVVFLLLTLKHKREDLKKIILLYSSLLIANFLIFSSYNYILNFIDFSSPFSSESNYLMHQFRGGIKGYIYNLISYSFGIFDMSGIKGIDVYNNFFSDLLQKVYSLIDISGKDYASKFFPYELRFTSTMTTGTCVLGALGLFSFLPCLIISIYNKIKYKYYEKSYVLFLITIAFVVNLLIFSWVMIFSTLNFRYFTAFITIATPICVYSYFKKNNFYKIILSFFIFTYLLLISTNKSIAFYLGYNHFKHTHKTIENPYNAFISTAREENSLFDYLKAKKAQKIAVIAERKDISKYDIEKLRLHGWQIDKLLLENIEEYQLDKYNYIIANDDFLTSSKILRYDTNIVSPYSECMYLNYKGERILQNSEERPVRVVCSLPFDYFNKNGFKIEKIIKIKTYKIIIMKRG